MGIFDIFAAGVAHAAGRAASDAVRERQKAEEKAARELDRRIELSGTLAEVNLEFIEACNALGFDGNHIGLHINSFDDEDDIIQDGASGIKAYKAKLDDYLDKLKEFKSLGGRPENLKYPWELEQYLSKLQYLGSIGCTAYQDDVAFQLDEEDMKFYLSIDLESRGYSDEQFALDIDSLSGVEFEDLCRKLVETMGFSAEMTKATGDGGIDIVAMNHQPLLSGKYIIQCKRYSGSVGEPVIRDLYGVVMSERANKGILMTTGTFTRQALAFADGKPLELIDGLKVGELLETTGLSAGARLNENAGCHASFSQDAYDKIFDSLRDLYSSVEHIMRIMDEDGRGSELIIERYRGLDDVDLVTQLDIELIAIIDYVVRGEGQAPEKEETFLNELLGCQGMDISTIEAIRSLVGVTDDDCILGSAASLEAYFSTVNEQLGDASSKAYPFFEGIVNGTAYIFGKPMVSDNLEAILPAFRHLDGSGKL